MGRKKRKTKSEKPAAPKQTPRLFIDGTEVEGVRGVEVYPDGKAVDLPEAEAQTPKTRVGETRYICADCGADLIRHKGGRYHPAFLARRFRCTGCGRETDQHITPRKICRL